MARLISSTSSGWNDCSVINSTNSLPDMGCRFVAARAAVRPFARSRMYCTTSAWSRGGAASSVRMMASLGEGPGGIGAQQVHSHVAGVDQVLVARLAGQLLRRQVVVLGHGVDDRLRAGDAPPRGGREIRDRLRGEGEGHVVAGEVGEG